MTANKLLQPLLDVNGAVVTDCEFSSDAKGALSLTATVRLKRKHSNRCPFCGRRCPGYDSRGTVRRWRGLDLGGARVFIACELPRVRCRLHGVVVAGVPWAYHGSGFTRAFDMLAARFAVQLPRKAVAEYLRVDWETVGRSVARVKDDLEPDPSARFDGLVRIGIDETSYRKGHKYLTVVVNHDTNEVVWVAEGFGRQVLERFYEALTPEQRAGIRVTTADGARWITDCVERYTPQSQRCIDSFHVSEWGIEALNKVKVEAWREALARRRELLPDTKRKAGRPRTDDAAAAALAKATKEAESIKNSQYALGKAHENLTENQQLKLAAIAVGNPRLYRAYTLKESLRLILKMTDADEAAGELRRWIFRATHSRIEQFKELGHKIKRHREHILNTIRCRMSNARIEATNNKIKLIIRKAYGFRNIGNLLAMVLLTCSKIRIPLPWERNLLRPLKAAN